MGFKPKSAQLESQLDNLTKGDPTEAAPPFKEKRKPDKASPELVNAIQERVAILRKPDVMTTDLSSVITQLQNIWEKVVAIELMVTAQTKPPKFLKPGDSRRSDAVIDETHPAAYPHTVNGGHPVTPKGKVASFIEVPSVEQLLARASAWKEKNGAPALVALVKQFGVRKIGEMSEEQRASFMEKLGE